MSCGGSTWNDDEWQQGWSGWWDNSGSRNYRGARGGSPWRASQVRRNWGQLGRQTQSWTTNPTPAVHPSLPQVPPPPTQQEGHWEVSYKWIPATSSTTEDQQAANPCNRGHRSGGERGREGRVLDLGGRRRVLGRLAA